MKSGSVPASALLFESSPHFSQLSSLKPSDLQPGFKELNQHGNQKQIQAQARDEKENKHHFCFILGNLKTSIKIDPSPSPTKKAKLCCSFCPQLKNIVFSEPKELMKHLVLAHKTKFFINEIQKQNEKKTPHNTN